MTEILDFADSRWFLPLINRVNPSGQLNSSRVLTERHKTCLADRYFTTRYLPDVGGEKEHDLCVMQHSNRICVIGLAAGHHLFTGCSPSPSLSSNSEKKNKKRSSNEDGTKSEVQVVNDCSIDEMKREEHVLLGIDFQLSHSFNLLNAKISGKRKRGSHLLQHSKQSLGVCVCSRGMRHPIICGVPGKLYECNPRLACSTHPSTPSEIPLTSLGHSADGHGVENQSFIGILMPPRTRPNGEEPKNLSSSNLTNQGIVQTGLDWETYRALRKL